MLREKFADERRTRIIKNKPGEFSDEQLIEKLAKASAEVADKQDVQDWIKWRDEQLVHVLKLQASAKATQPKQ